MINMWVWFFAHWWSISVVACGDICPTCIWRISWWWSTAWQTCSVWCRYWRICPHQRLHSLSYLKHLQNGLAWQWRHGGDRSNVPSGGGRTSARRGCINHAKPCQWQSEWSCHYDGRKGRRLDPGQCSLTFFAISFFLWLLTCVPKRFVIRVALQEIRSMERVSAQCCYTPYTIIKIFDSNCNDFELGRFKVVKVKGHGANRPMDGFLSEHWVQHRISHAPFSRYLTLKIFFHRSNGED